MTAISEFVFAADVTRFNSKFSIRNSKFLHEHSL